MSPSKAQGQQCRHPLSEQVSPRPSPLQAVGCLDSGLFVSPSTPWGTAAGSHREGLFTVHLARDRETSRNESLRSNFQLLPGAGEPSTLGPEEMRPHCCLWLRFQELGDTARRRVR